MSKEQPGPLAGTKSERRKGPDKQKISAYLPLSLAREVNAYRFWNEMTISELISAALEEHLPEYPELKED